MTATETAPEAAHAEGPRRMIGRRAVSYCRCGRPWPCDLSWQARAEEAEGKLAQLRTVLLEGGQDAVFARRRALAIVAGHVPANAWPADGDAGICPDCDKPVYFTSASNGYGTWFHDSGTEDCEAETPGPSLVCPGCGSPDVDLRRGLLCGTCSPVKPCGCDPSHRCLDCATGDEVPAVRALDAIAGHVRGEVES